MFCDEVLLAALQEISTFSTCLYLLQPHQPLYPHNTVLQFFWYCSLMIIIAYISLVFVCCLQKFDMVQRCKCHLSVSD